MANKDLKAYLRSRFIPQWKLAIAMGVSEPTLTRRLREELPPEEKKMLICLIDQIAQAQEKE